MNQSPPDDADRLNAFARIHRQMAEAHIATQRALADSHAAYLRASEMALRLAAGHLPDAGDVTAEAVPDNDIEAEAGDMAPPPPAAGDIFGTPFAHEPAPVIAEEATTAPAPASETVPETVPETAPLLLDPVAAEPLWYEPALQDQALAEALPPAPAWQEAEGEPFLNQRVIGDGHVEIPAHEALVPDPLLSASAHDPAYVSPHDPARVSPHDPARVSPHDAAHVSPHDPPAHDVRDSASPAGWAEPAAALEQTPTPLDPDAAPSAMPEPHPAALRRLALVAHEEAAPGSAMPGLRAGSRILLVGGPDVARNAIAQALTAAGLELATTTAYVDALISLHGLTENAGPRAAFEAALAVFAAAQSIAAHPPSVFIAVQDGGGDFGLSGAAPARAWTAGFAGFTRTIAREWPECATKTIDISELDPDRLAMRLTRELVFGGTEDMVGLSADNRRLVPREAELHPAVSAPIDLPDDAVIIVSGGARGTTAACLAALCRGRRLRLCLLGRTAFETSQDDTPESTNALRERLLTEAAAAGRALSPAELLTALGDIRAQREVRETITQLAQAGADIRYHVIDINDAAAVAGAVARTREEFGRIDGVIHAAGIIADRRIADKTESQFARVFATKVDGLANLLAATADDRLRLLVMFGALAGRYGNLGQADYAVANATLAAVARAEALRRGNACLVKSIAWGPWDGGMLDASLKSSFDRHGGGDERAAGALAFLAELGQAAGDVVSTDIVFAPSVVAE